MNLDDVTLETLEGIVLKVIKNRPFIATPSQNCVMADAGETVVFLSFIVKEHDYVHVYFLHRGCIVREGAGIRHNANDVKLALESCLEDMEKL